MLSGNVGSNYSNFIMINVHATISDWEQSDDDRPAAVWETLLVLDTITQRHDLIIARQKHQYCT